MWQWYRFAAKRCSPPSRIIHDDIENMASHSLPVFDLVFTSPPYGSFRDPRLVDMNDYLYDFELIFCSLRSVLKPSSRVVVEISNTIVDGLMRPIVWDAAKILGRYYRFCGEIIRCNSGPEQAGPGFDHSYLLVYDNASGPSARRP